MSGSTHVCVRSRVCPHSWTGWEPGDQASLICHTLNPICLGQFGGPSACLCTPPICTCHQHPRWGATSWVLQSLSISAETQVGGVTCLSSRPRELQTDAPPSRSEPGREEAPLRLGRCRGTRHSGLRDAGRGAQVRLSRGSPRPGPSCDFRGTTSTACRVVTPLWEAWL